jgi:putative redox protein
MLRDNSMVDIYTAYEGELHCTARHGPSGVTLATDAPVDNHGRGGSFSPTDLMATALGTCMLTTMGILAKKRSWAITGIAAHVQKEMTTVPPRRVARLPVVMDIPTSVARALDADARVELEQAAHNCPVRISLADTVEVPVEFRWGA